MASFINFGKAEGSAVVDSILLAPSKTAAINAGTSYVWTKLQATSPDPHQMVPYPGRDGIKSKHMGARSDRVVIEGFVIGDNDIAINNAAKVLRRLNNTAVTWLVSFSGESTSNLSSADSLSGFILNDIILLVLGEGTGTEWPFELHLTDTGG